MSNEDIGRDTANDEQDSERTNSNSDDVEYGAGSVDYEAISYDDLADIESAAWTLLQHVAGHGESALDRRKEFIRVYQHARDELDRRDEERRP